MSIRSICNNTITWGNKTIDLGTRIDYTNGLTVFSLPKVGIPRPAANLRSVVGSLSPRPRK